MWRTVHSFRGKAFLTSCPPPQPPSPVCLQPPGPACEPAGWPDAPWMEQAYKESEREGKREREEGEREGEVIVGDYSNLFLTSARSLSLCCRLQLKARKLWWKSTFDLVNQLIWCSCCAFWPEKTKHTLRIGCAPWGKLEICLCLDKSYNFFLIVLQWKLTEVSSQILNLMRESWRVEDRSWHLPITFVSYSVLEQTGSKSAVCPRTDRMECTKLRWMVNVLIWLIAKLLCKSWSGNFEK